jgi:hypothetical protein
LEKESNYITGSGGWLLCWLVGWLVGDHFLLSGLRPWDNIYNVCVVIAVDMVTLLEIVFGGKA